MLLSRRRREPAHYLLKIDSFSVLSEAKTIKVESDVFEASGHKWRLELFPNGNDDKSDGKHICLYLVICDTQSLLKGWEVCVDINVFVYDHISHNYVSFQDGEGNRIRFHEKNIEWGFDNLIQLDYFKDSKNGYLFNDSCVFGAEIFAVPEFAKIDRCLSMIKPPEAINTHTWTIRNFSAVLEENIFSEIFKVGKVKWKLSLYPKGYKEGEGTHLSIFLKVDDDALLPDGWRVYAKYKLRVKNQSGTVNREIETDHWFCNSDVSWGFRTFIPLSTLEGLGYGYFLNDTIVVEAEISAVGTFKNFF